MKKKNGSGVVKPPSPKPPAQRPSAPKPTVPKPQVPKSNDRRVTILPYPGPSKKPPVKPAK